MEYLKKGMVKGGYEKINLKRGFINLCYHIWRLYFFFLTWRTESRRKFFFGVFYLKNEELTNFSVEI